MKWTEITVFTTDEGLDAVCARLDMLGLCEVVIEPSRKSVDALLAQTAQYWDYAEPDEWNIGDEPRVKAYVRDASRVEEITESFAQLKREALGIDLGSLRVVVRMADDEDWANNWKQYYKPLKIGERLLVCPAWEEAKGAHRTILYLEPGMAFGTGEHQTTRMCLFAIEQLVKSGDKVLDLGCGSGILFIAALLLGAEYALGVDIDEMAVKIAHDNARRNRIPREKYEVMAGDALHDDALIARLKAKEKYDIVIANIIASVVIELCPLISALVKKGGAFIASGIIAEKLDEVKEAMHNNGMRIESIDAEDDWRAIRAIRE